MAEAGSHALVAKVRWRRCGVQRRSNVGAAISRLAASVRDGGSCCQWHRRQRLATTQLVRRRGEGGAGGPALLTRPLCSTSRAPRGRALAVGPPRRYAPRLCALPTRAAPPRKRGNRARDRSPDASACTVVGTARSSALVARPARSSAREPPAALTRAPLVGTRMRAGAAVAAPLAVAVALAVLAVAGDVAAAAVARSRRVPQVAALLLDSCVHGSVAAAMWAATLLLAPHAALGGSTMSAPVLLAAAPAQTTAALLPPPWLQSAAIAGVVAMALDADHFIAAGSLSVRGAMTLSSRPFGHALAFTVAVAATCRWLWPRSLAWLMVCVALGSHIMRDAPKRGLWMWPGPHTPRLPYAVYVATVAVAPLLLAAWLRRGHARMAASAGGGGGGGESGGGGGGDSLV